MKIGTHLTPGYVASGGAFIRERLLLDEELYDPDGWAREADGEHAWVEQLEVHV